MTIHRVCVIVPAADEQHNIARCLHSIERAHLHLLASISAALRVQIIVVLDGCRDRTPVVVAEFVAAGRVEQVISTARRVGAARHDGAYRAIEGTHSPEGLWLANTDADSTVPDDWLVAMVAAANAGADVVLGTVVPDSGLSPILHAAWHARHDLREGHPHVHGANLGIRGSTYLSLGGWRRGLRSHEDVDLAERASSAGVAVLRTARIPVTTSTRMKGQAPGGFASYLRNLRDAASDSADGLGATRCG